jgi:hypothetical protein
MSGVPEKGFLRDYPLPAMLITMGRNRATGVLRISSRGVVKKLCLDKGKMAFASSTAPEERLGEMLFQAGRITVKQYDKVVKAMKQTGRKQGDLLVELGIMKPRELFESLKQQVREIVFGLFRLEDGLYEFRPGELQDDTVALDLSMANIIYEGIKRITDPRRIKRDMPDVNNVLMISHDPMSLFQDISLTGEEKHVLELVDGDRTIGGIIEDSGLGELEARKIMYVLWSIGMVTEQFDLHVPDLTIEDILAPVEDEREEFLARVNAVHSVLGSMDEHKLLAVEKGADFQEIERQYYKLSKEFHPDRHPDLGEPERDRIADIFGAIGGAYETQRRRQLERTYTEGDEDLAQALLKEGREELEKGNSLEAARFLEEAVRADPDNAYCWHYLSLALRKLPGRFQRAEEAERYAQGLDPDNSEFFVFMGKLYLDTGRSEEAREQFEQAYAIDPMNAQAKEAVFWFRATDRKR